MHNTRGEIMTDYTTQVQSGIKLLDGYFGSRAAWTKDIDLDTLDLGSCGVCVLGQLFGDYSEGLDTLNIGGGYSYGFDTSGSFRELTQAWKDALGKNNTLVEQGDVYKDVYGYAVKVIGTQIVRLSDTETVTVYLVTTGKVNNGVYTEYKNGKGSPEVTVLQKKDFESDGTYNMKVERLALKTGMFIEARNGKKYFVHSPQEVRELVDGAYAVNVNSVDLDGAKELKTGMGVTFAKSVKNSLV
ncbi:hypothetical protein SEA_ROSEPHARIE_84 [Streptomyces phage RosePharie]|nr:hypothetical protein SEA_ROSEPHARIE_84 [Streptomyces phage RosePharie]